LADEKKEREHLKLKLEQINSAIRKQQIAYEAEVIFLDEFKTRISELRYEKQEILDKIEFINKKRISIGYEAIFHV